MLVSQDGLSFNTDDGISIKAYHFHGQVASDNRVMIILPATGATQTRYFNFARFLAEHGWHVITFDYRGIGESKGEFNTSTLLDERYSMVSWGKYDLDCCLQWAKEKLRARHIAVTAHSIGGQIIPLADRYQDIDAVLAIAAQKGYWKNWPAPHKWAVASFFKLYIPLCLKLYGFVPLQWFGLDDLPKAVAQDYAKWTTGIDYVDRAGNSFLTRFEKLMVPMLSLSFSDDLNYAPKHTVDDLAFNYYKNATVWRSHITPQYYSLAKIGHSGFFDSTIMPVIAWHDANQWLQTVLYHPEKQYQFNSLPMVNCDQKKFYCS